VAAVLNGKHFIRSQRTAGQPVDAAEITLEITHSIIVKLNIIIQPDVQIP
jgi:hypothetical protein